MMTRRSQEAAQVEIKAASPGARDVSLRWGGLSGEAKRWNSCPAMAPLQVPVLCFLLGLTVVSAGLLDGKRPACSPKRCKLPNCLCSGTSPPKRLPVKVVPQIIMMSFDDAINWRMFPYYEKLLNGKLKNPNGCPIGATFFVSHHYTQYNKVQSLYERGHEIAVHTITHRYPNRFWKNATYDQYDKEIAGMRQLISKFGQVKKWDIQGFRAPFLQVGGNTEFKLLRDKSFLYDSSMPTRRYLNPPLWPYSLDYPRLQECMMPPCPTGSFPGLWEVPMVSYRDLQGHICSMLDACAPPKDEDDVLNLLEKNFKRHYESNRAPFPMFMHAVWFQRYPFALRAVKKFLKKKLKLRNVWAVTISQALDWIRTPVPLKKLRRFRPWRCEASVRSAGKNALAKDPCKANICPYDKDLQLLEPFAVGVRHYLYTCNRDCSPGFPWYGNPTGKQCRKKCHKPSNLWG